MTSEQSSNGTEQPRSYQSIILNDYGSLFVVAFILGSLMIATFYWAALTHAYVYPVFEEEIASTIAQKPKWAYALNAVVFTIGPLIAHFTYDYSK